MKITTTKQVRQHGNSLTVNVTKECGILGVGRGDIVIVTVDRLDNESQDYTDDDVKYSMTDERYASH